MNYTSLSAIADLLLPRTCLVCGRTLLPSERHLCLPCRVRIPFTHFESSSHNPMADRLNEAIQRQLGEDSDTGFREKYSYACALFYYDGISGYEKIPQSLKYHGNIRCGEYFGTLLGERMKSSPLFADVDLIVPVPLHWTRKWKRGYNQAEVIGEGVSKILGAEMDDRLLTRNRRTTTQTKTGVENKRLNVKGAFSISENHRHKPDTAPVHILLTDDTFTTGATLSECHKTLRSHFGPGCRISVATLAFVGH